MNVHERLQLTRFLQELILTRANSKDIEAEKLIQETCGRQPDAQYLLVQRNLLLEQALQNLQAENSRLQNALETTRGTGGNFLSANAWGNSSAPSPAAQSAPNCAPSAPPVSTQAPSASWGSGMLGTVATTAAGVVAGSFLFQGIEHLTGNHGSGSGFLGGQSSSPMTNTSSENVAANNSVDAGNTASDFDLLIPSDDDLGSV